MRRTSSLILSTMILLSIAILPLSAAASPTLTIIEWSVDQSNGLITLQAIPATDDSLSNTNYLLTGLTRTSTANYWINPSNKFGLIASSVISTIQTAADTWDTATSFTVFAYKGTTTRTAGKYDGYNVVAWGTYGKSAIAVTYIWSISGQVVETDTRMNSLYKWSLSGAAGKMDVQDIMTHEFGHWFVLDDLYADADYWLTMYGYAGYGETYKRSLGLGDIMGLQDIYGA